MNPFYHAYALMTNESLKSKVLNAAVMWDIASDDGKNADDDKLYTTLQSNDLNDIWLKYIVFKNNGKNEFDHKAFEDAVQMWAISISFQ